MGVISGTDTITFTYDADGALVKKVTPEGVTHYAGQHYERALGQGSTEIVIGPTPPCYRTPIRSEVGQIDDALTHTPQTVILSQSYVAPVVFAQPPSTDGANTSVVRVTDVQPDRFTLYVHEAPDQDGSHTTETVSYIVLDAGTWEVAGGRQLEVGTLDTDATVGKRVTNVWAQVVFPQAFAAAPVVLSQVQSNADPHWVKTRKRNVGTGGFDVALEEEEASASAHGTETVGWLAIDGGPGTWNGHAFEAVQTGNAVTHNWYALSSGGSYAAAPRFVASQATYDGGDNCALRYQNLAASGVAVKVEEDTTWDSETNHTTEAVAYLALEGDGLLTAVSGPGGDRETSYYYLPSPGSGLRGSQRVAMRQEGVLYFIVGDPTRLRRTGHLGTTGAVFDAGGSLHRQSRHSEASRSAAACPGAVPGSGLFVWDGAMGSGVGADGL